MSSLFVNASQRNFTVAASLRNYSTYASRRNFSTATSKRDFGVAIQGWRLWGQTDVHPFQVGGEDSTKTFGELP